MDLLGIEFENSLLALWKTLFYAGVFLVLFYLVFLILSKLLYRKRQIAKDLSLIMTMKWVFVVLMVLLNLFLFFIIRINGIGNFEWTNWTSYLGVIHLIVVFLVIVISFYLTHYLLNRKIKTL